MQSHIAARNHSGSTKLQSLGEGRHRGKRNERDLGTGTGRRARTGTGRGAFPPNPDYPFQMIVADYFSMHGHNFLMIADRFTGWNTIVSNPHGKFDGQHLVSNMRDLCATWNIPEHITIDGGPQMMSGVIPENG